MRVPCAGSSDDSLMAVVWIGHAAIWCSHDGSQLQKMMRPTTSRRGSWGLDIALAVAIVMYWLGVLGPLFTVDKLLIFSDTVSIASSLMQLAAEGYVFLFLIVLVFSVLLPMCKLGALAYMRWLRPSSATGLLRWIERLAKWSMLDVFVVALLVVSIKLDLVATVHVHYGLYAFATSVLLSMAVAALLPDPSHDIEAMGPTPAS